jgi:hypothetical protein
MLLSLSANTSSETISPINSGKPTPHIVPLRSRYRSLANPTNPAGIFVCTVTRNGKRPHVHVILREFGAQTYLSSLRNKGNCMIDLGTEAHGIQRTQSSSKTNGHLPLLLHIQRKGQDGTLAVFYCCIWHASTSSNHNHPSSMNQAPPGSALSSEKTGSPVVQPSPPRSSHRTREAWTVTVEMGPGRNVPMARGYPSADDKIFPSPAGVIYTTVGL